MQWVTKSARQSNNCHYIEYLPVPVAARSKAWVCCCSPTESVGSSPNGGMSVVSVVCCQVEVSATGLSLVQRSPLSVCCECCVSGRDLCDGLIPCPEESYGCLSVVSVVCCQVEISAMG